jgi:hypothetical protein
MAFSEPISYAEELASEEGESSVHVTSEEAQAV